MHCQRIHYYPAQPVPQLQMPRQLEYFHCDCSRPGYHEGTNNNYFSVGRGRGRGAASENVWLFLGVCWIRWNKIKVYKFAWSCHILACRFELNLYSQNLAFCKIRPLARWKMKSPGKRADKYEYEIWLTLTVVYVWSLHIVRSRIAGTIRHLCLLTQKLHYISLKKTSSQSSVDATATET